ncbi:histidine kinase [Corynebacterium sp. H128]|uniref:sensor histidine kinase n=1 Tax=unclassified Corynebacterium TaxID=2624378 RepID=UPI0030B3F92C
MVFDKNQSVRFALVTALCVLMLFLWSLSVFVVSPTEAPTRFLYLALVLCVPFAAFSPRTATWFYLLLFTFTIFSDLNPGILTLTAIVLLAILVAQHKHVTGFIFAALIVLLGFYSPEHHRLEGDPESFIVFTAMLVFASVIGWWIDRSRRQQRRREETSNLRRRELAALLHDTVAADLTSLTVRLEALAITTPDKASQLQTCAQLARKTMADTRTLLQELNEPIDQTTSRPVPALNETLHEVTELLRSHNFNVQTTTELTSFPSQEHINRALHQCLHEIATNAIKYAAPSSTILFTAFIDNERIEITMTNEYSPNHNIKNSSKLGLESIRKRLAAINGVMTIQQTSKQWKIALAIER